MKRLTISGLAALALLAAATTMLRSHAADHAVASKATMSLQELHAAAGVNQLPIEQFEDQSLVFSTVTKR